MKEDITVIIHTKNESEYISDCIKSAKLLTSKIIVVDMHSTDKTVRLAKAAGAKVRVVNDVGYVEPARQKAIKLVTTSWVLLLDADERISPKLAYWIQQYLRKPSHHDVVRLARKNMVLGKWMRHGLRWPDYQVRLFRKNAVRWPKEIHSQPITSLPMLDTPAQESLALLHLHSQTLDELLTKCLEQAKRERYFCDGSHDLSSALNRITNEFQWRFLEHGGGVKMDTRVLFLQN